MMSSDEMRLFAISEVARKPIRDYCENLKYKCKGCRCEGCRYSIKFIIPDYKGYTTCIFGDCPCSWEIDKAEVKI